MLTDGRTVLLTGLLDFGGALSPTSLPLDDAVAEYHSFRSGPRGALAGRFACPSSRLVDLAGELVTTLRAGDDPWSLAVVFDQAPSTSAANTQAFATEMTGAASVDIVEAALDPQGLTAGPVSLRRLIDACSAVGPTVTTFVELPFATHPEASMDILPTLAGLVAERSTVVGLKLRCGPTRDVVPPSSVLAEVIRWSNETGVPLKAAGGLESPVRHYDEDRGGHRHGFLNLLAAMALADEHRLPVPDLVTVLDDTAATAFDIGLAGLRWGELRAGTATLMRLRSQRFPSFTCAGFTGPVSGLEELGLLT